VQNEAFQPLILMERTQPRESAIMSNSAFSWRRISLVVAMLGGLAAGARGEEWVTVTVGDQSVGNVHPLNVHFVEAQLKRVDAIQSRLNMLKEQQATLPKKIEQMNHRVRALADQQGAAKDPELTRLRAEADRLSAQVAQGEKALAGQKPGSFTNYSQFVAYDRMTAQLEQVRHQAHQAGEQAKARVRALAARDPEGRKLVDEVWAVEVELALANKDRGNVQIARDNLKREVGNLLKGIAPQGAPNDKGGIEVPVPPPADAAARMERFRKRNTPEEVRALGDRFFAQIDLSHPGLEEVASHVIRSDFPAALEAYKRFFFRRASAAANVEAEIEAEVEEAEEEMDEGGGGGAEVAWRRPSGGAHIRPPHPRAVERAMTGEISAYLPVAHKKMDVLVARMSPPGAINWAFPAYAPENTTPDLRGAYEELANRHSGGGALGSILLDSYVLTGNREHLNRWTEFTDDWSMNWSRDIDNAGLIRNYNMLIGYQHHQVIGRLVGSAALNPKLVDDLPATTLARLLLAANAEYLTSAIRLMRSGQYNFRVMMLTGMLPHVLDLQEFNSVRWAAREATRLTEMSMTHNIRRDGANATLANAGHENTDGSFLGLTNVMAKAQPDWLSPWWNEELVLNLKTFTRYWMHMMKQDGRAFRISTSPLHGHFAPGGSIKVNLLSDEPEVRARMWKVYQQALPYDDPAAAQRAWSARLRGEPEPQPQIRSESMAFSGYNFLRTGWNTSDRFLYFHNLNVPVASGRDDANGFALWGFVSAPPVFIDGRIQYIGLDLPPWSGGKGMFSVSAKPDAVKETRFHSSDAFDLAEGLYQGPYAFNPDYRKSAFADIFGNWSMDLTVKRLRTQAEREGRKLDETPIRDVKHGRQVISVQGRDLYIVTDFVDTPTPRNIEQKYQLPTPIIQAGKSLAKRLELLEQEKFASVRVDRAQRIVQVRNPGLNGMDMYHFGNVDLNYWLSEPYVARLKKMPTDAPAPYGRAMSLSWKSEGPSTLATVIAPHRAFYEKEPAPVFQRVQPLQGGPGLAGFSGTLADGTAIFYAASQTPARFKTAGLEATARSLLRIGDKGIALDCTELSVGGRAMKAPHPDFEFELASRSASASLARVVPIYRPIKPVTISPETTVFAGEQAVTLSCATPGVEIRYTLDGSDPRHDSALYTGPFTIRDTTWIKARAFRKGMTYTPWVEDGTHATVMSWAILEKVELQTAEDVAGTRPGLHYEYVEDLWPYLLSEGLTLPAKKSGFVSNVLDVSPKETTQPYAIRYEGYLDVPQDGVYTFHAPSEWMLPDNESGYDLRVFVNGQEWYPNTRWHAHGNWSVALKKGKHAFKVLYADLRRTPHRTEAQWGFPKEGFVWKGVAPELKISGPGLEKQAIPSHMLSTL
jgi:hypothetical protein